MRGVIQSLVFAAGAMAAGVVLAEPGDDAASSRARAEGASMGEKSPAAVVPEPGKLVRVGGDMTAQVERVAGGFYKFGAASITTELPNGYPEPTPPGAIDIKTYPSVRRAEVSGKMAPDIGMNFGFFPLFNHIKRRNIAMTSPVEMDYKGIDWTPEQGGGVAADSWTMSFLYRKPELGETGKDEKDAKVRVVDTAPVTVVSKGRKGTYRFTDARKVMEELDAWLKERPEWEKAGEPRVFYYNGPDVRERDKWSEVQWPIRARGTGAAETVPVKLEETSEKKSGGGGMDGTGR